MFVFEQCNFVVVAKWTDTFQSLNPDINYLKAEIPLTAFQKQNLYKSVKWGEKWKLLLSFIYFFIFAALQLK